jgi:hypothetical protein
MVASTPAPLGPDFFLPSTGGLVESFEGPSASGYFRSPGDFMTGGNARHNAAIDQLVVQEALRILEGRQMSVDPGMVRRYVHDELRHYKVNEAGRRNGNVDHSDFQEIVDNTVSHFGGRVRNAGPRALETSEDVNWRIEDLIEEELFKTENVPVVREISLERLETLRATMRTRLRAEFAHILMNEAYTENIEDVADFFRDSIVSTFEERAPGILENAVGEVAVCDAAAPGNGGPLPSLSPPAGPAAGLPGVLVSGADARPSGRIDRDVVRSQVLLRYPRFLSQTAREALEDGRPLPEGSDLINSRFTAEVDRIVDAVVARYETMDRSETERADRDRLWREEAERGFAVRDGVPDRLLIEVANDHFVRESRQNASPFGGGVGAGFRADSERVLERDVYETGLLELSRRTGR